MKDYSEISPWRFPGTLERESFQGNGDTDGIKGNIVIFFDFWWTLPEICFLRSIIILFYTIFLKFNIPLGNNINTWKAQKKRKKKEEEEQN